MHSEVNSNVKGNSGKLTDCNVKSKVKMNSKVNDIIYFYKRTPRLKCKGYRSLSYLTEGLKLKGLMSDSECPK